MLSVDVAEAMALTVTLSDMSGRILYRGKYNTVAGNNRIELATDNLSNGLYIISLTGSHLSNIAKVSIK